MGDGGRTTGGNRCVPNFAMMPATATSRIPSKADLIIKLQALGSFTGWDGKTAYTITKINPYVAPGNSPKVKGRMAVWLTSPNSKRNLIIFVDLVLAAIRFIKEPAKRGAFSHVAPTNFSGWASQKPAYRNYPSMYGNAGTYLALAKILLGLPANWVEPAAVLKRAVADAEEHPDISMTDGLLLDTLYAFVEGADAPDPTDLPARAFAALKRRYGTSSRHKLDDDLVIEVRDLSDRAKVDPDHEDIVEAPVVWFAMLYLNAMEWMGRVKSSAVTTVVNRLAEAHDVGCLRPLMKRMDRKAAKAAAESESNVHRWTKLARRRSR
jgi:hypothetical protein